MTTAEMASYIRLKTRTNSSTFTNADMLVLANVIKNEICKRALETDEDIFLVPSYMNLVASSSSREYPLSSNLLSRIKRVEAKLDGSNWLKLEEFDITQYKEPISTEADIVRYFSNVKGKAFFDMMRKSLFIYSGTINAVSDGLRVWQNTWPADFTDMAGSTDASQDPSSTTHGTPKELHYGICTGVIIEWKGSREKPIPLNERELRFEFDVQQAIQSLKKGNYDREVIGYVPNTYDMSSEDGSNL